ncbi:melanoma antigen preferentially expressed in tumors [Echinops telfairi]|uniref:Melanoma antigen preferentially expressed in tumors n=4 Tax=Echinops telfairi TaxID=9371 RepID=A0AC55D1F8_ECHTE|nr:melanoma antigen preferentially expressed in tumors [Echinops telfairi]XP_045145579.1 melanoma antigen preferentially expressed in tumors [Echinops telfairi]XP_045145580.1 melanoma antigen preferentially expressed in tumors [Echinops telfairi]XP_045145581.1 melanoma antigen preferentially expressed in tumors [Echinops telfairi]
MSSQTPSSLLELAGKALLKHKALAIDSLELMPVELFPPLLKIAVDGRHLEILQAMIQAWPLPLLPLGTLLVDQQCHQEILWVALRGLDALLDKVRPRRWKLQVLDLRHHAHQKFWAIWANVPVKSHYALLPDAEEELPVAMKARMEGARNGDQQQPRALGPVEVVMNICLNKPTLDEFLSALLKKARQKHGLLHLCCRKLQLLLVPLRNTERVLKTVQLDSIQNLEMDCTWRLPTLSRFALYLGQMVNLRQLHLCHLQTLPSHHSRAKEEQYVCQFTAPFANLRHLRELRLDSVSFLEGRLHHLLRHLSTPLESLSFSSCLLLESDLVHLSLCPSTSQLKDLSLSEVSLSSGNIGPLAVLLEHTSATLQDLDLDDCGMLDAQFNSIMPSLGRCSQLMALSFCGNQVSFNVLESLLRHTARLPHLSNMLYPAPLESYEEGQDTVHLGRLTQHHSQLMQILWEAGRSSTVWLSANLCPHCGDRFFYNPNPILCPCYEPPT